MAVGSAMGINPRGYSVRDVREIEDSIYRDRAYQNGYEHGRAGRATEEMTWSAGVCRDAYMLGHEDGYGDWLAWMEV